MEIAVYWKYSSILKMKAACPKRRCISKRHGVTLQKMVIPSLCFRLFYKSVFVYQYDSYTENKMA